MIVTLKVSRPPRARRLVNGEYHPLTQWREKYQVFQLRIQQETGINQIRLSRIENGRLIPTGETLEILMSYTGLEAEAFIRPVPYMAKHPDFLQHAHPPKLPDHSVA